MTSTVFPVITIMGPTASGKTGLAIDLANKLDGEIISVDSALIYKGMDIGTAKPTLAERQGVKHWLIDTHDPLESYSVSAFFDDAVNLVKDIQLRGKVPILVGGTMMYFNALVKGIAPLPKGDIAVKSMIEKEAQEQGWEKLHTMLSNFDPECAKKIHPNDAQRITRGLEVYRMTNKPMSWWHKQPLKQAGFKLQQFAIAPQNRIDLHRRIAERFEVMIANGFKAEVEKLYTRPDLHKELPAIRAVGYRQMWEHLQGLFTETEMLERGVIATRQLAKRQLTWLRSWESIYWLDTFDNSRLDKILAKITP